MKNLTVDERLDKYVDFCFDVGTLVKAYGDREDNSVEMRAKAFDKLVERTLKFIKEVQSWG